MGRAGGNNLQQHPIDISALTSGVYLLHINSPDGSNTIRLVKQ